MQAGSSTESNLLYEQKHYSETLMIPAPIGELLSLLAGALAGRCPILTSASQSGAVSMSEVITIQAEVNQTALRRVKKTPKADEK